MISKLKASQYFGQIEGSFGHSAIDTSSILAPEPVLTKSRLLDGITRAWQIQLPRLFNRTDHAEATCHLHLAGSCSSRFIAPWVSACCASAVWPKPRHIYDIFQENMSKQMLAWWSGSQPGSWLYCCSLSYDPPLYFKALLFKSCASSSALVLPSGVWPGVTSMPQYGRMIPQSFRKP